VNNHYIGPSGSSPFPQAASRGPYLSSVDSDPWGSKYLLTAVNLAPNVSTTEEKAFQQISSVVDGADLRFW